MRPLRSVCIYLTFVFVTGGLLAPWLYGLAAWGASLSPTLEALARLPFERFVNRSLIVLGVLGLWPFLKCLGMNSWHSLGLKSSAWSGKEAGCGFLLGLGSLAIIALVSVAVGARTLEGGRTGAEIIQHLGNASLAAVVVGLLEEVFFRGALFGALRKALSWPKALWLSSGFYALVHFFERPESPASVNWVSGLAVLGQMMRGFGDWEKLVPGLINLMLAGAILARGYQFTGSLHFSIGLHAGWVFWLKSYGFMTRQPEAASTWIWGTGKLIDGWLASAVLATLLVFAWRRTDRELWKTASVNSHSAD